MPIAESKVFNTFETLSTYALKDVYFQAMYNLCFDIKRSWLAQRIRKSQNGVKGLTAKLPYLLQYGWSLRPMSEHGYTPTGSPMSGATGEFELGIHAGSVIVSLKELYATDGDQSLMGDIMEREMTGLMECWPYYMKTLFWTPTSGVMGVVAVNSTGTTVTIDNTGLWNTLTKDRCKLFIPGMWVSFRSSAGVSRGDPRRVTFVNQTLGTFTIDAAINISDGDYICITDVQGLEDGYNNETSPGIYDAIDDSNTFQGIDRSDNTYSRLRAVVDDASGVPRAPTRALLANFFHNCYDPDEAITHYDQLENLFNILVLTPANRRFVNVQDYKDSFNSIQVGKTWLTEDDDHDRDKITVVDWSNVFLVDKGEVGDLFGRGWYPLETRPFMCRNVAWCGLLVAQDVRKCGVLKDLTCAWPS